MGVRAEPAVTSHAATSATDVARPAVRIVFADEHLLAVDKPAGMPSVPARTPHDPPSVATVLAATHGDLEAVHRLDRDTSGLLLLARTPAARAALGRSFESRAVGKLYLAIVRGSPPGDSGQAHLPLADDPLLPPRKRVDPVFGRRAVTRWQTLTRRDVMGVPASLLEVEPVTGRSHQLRAHLAWLGCAILGDRLYDATTIRTQLALHAAAIRFPHPVTAVPVLLTCPPPPAAPWTSFPESAAAVSGASARGPSG